MTNIDKFSFALKKGFNTFGQPSEILQNSEGNLFVNISHFSFSQTSDNSVKIESHGFQIFEEGKIEKTRAAYIKNNANPASLEMLRQADAAFKMIREDAMSLEDANKILRDKTEDFFQTYIVGETIEQTYNPLFRSRLPEKPQNPEDEFNHRRTLQRIDEKIGTVCKIDPSEIRHAWGLD